MTNQLTVEQRQQTHGVVQDIDSHTDACRQLWCAVLLVQFQTVFPSRDPRRKFRKDHWDELSVEESVRWFGSANFRQVCALAGVDDEFVMLGFERRMEMAGQR